MVSPDPMDGRSRWPAPLFAAGRFRPTLRRGDQRSNDEQGDRNGDACLQYTAAVERRTDRPGSGGGAARPSQSDRRVGAGGRTSEEERELPWGEVSCEAPTVKPRDRTNLRRTFVRRTIVRSEPARRAAVKHEQAFVVMCYDEHQFAASGEQQRTGDGVGQPQEE
jgi:hypothetical protein